MRRAETKETIHVTPEERRLRALESEGRADPDPARQAHGALESALFEIKRVIVGQEAMLERVLVALLAGGHVLLEGVPGLAKTLTVKTVADVLGGSFKRLQFTPDLPPAPKHTAGPAPPPPRAAGGAARLFYFHARGHLPAPARRGRGGRAF